MLENLYVQIKKIWNSTLIEVKDKSKRINKKKSAIEPEKVVADWGRKVPKKAKNLKKLKQLTVMEDEEQFTKMVEKLAYRKWEEAGRPEGDGQEFWVKAEQELKKKENLIQEEDKV